LKIEVVRPTDLGDPEIKRWRTLQRAVPSLGNPFLSPDFTLAIGRFRPEARVAVLSEGADVVGFFPYERSPLGLGRPIGAGLTDCQGMIAEAGAEVDARALLKACQIVVWEFDHLLADQAAFVPFHAVQRTEPVIDLGDGLDAYLAEVKRHSPKALKTVRYKDRKLGREAGEVSYVFAETDPAELRRLMTWKSDQYRRTGRSDRFAKPWIVALVEHLHQTGVAVLSVVRTGDQPISAHLGLRCDDVMAGWFPAYDTEYAKYSPGMIGHLRLAEGAAANGIRQIAMGRGGREYKDWLKNGEFAIAEGRVARASARAGLHWAKDAPLRRARTAVLASPRLYARADRVLKQYARLRTRSASTESHQLGGVQ
jgi:CelD/BcsL family acetyltransferase involved in cellulose biosynthesis